MVHAHGTLRRAVLAHLALLSARVVRVAVHALVPFAARGAVRGRAERRRFARSANPGTSLVDARLSRAARSAHLSCGAAGARVGPAREANAILTAAVAGLGTAGLRTGAATGDTLVANTTAPEAVLAKAPAKSTGVVRDPRKARRWREAAPRAIRRAAVRDLGEAGPLEALFIRRARRTKEPVRPANVRRLLPRRDARAGLAAAAGESAGDVAVRARVADHVEERAVVRRIVGAGVDRGVGTYVRIGADLRLLRKSAASEQERRQKANEGFSLHLAPLQGARTALLARVYGEKEHDPPESPQLL